MSRIIQFTSKHSIRLKCEFSVSSVSNKISILQLQKKRKTIQEAAMWPIVSALGTNKKLHNHHTKRNEQLAVRLIFPPISKCWHTEPDIKTKNIRAEFARQISTHTHTHANIYAKKYNFPSILLVNHPAIVFSNFYNPHCS